MFARVTCLDIYLLALGWRVKRAGVAALSSNTNNATNNAITKEYWNYNVLARLAFCEMFSFLALTLTFFKLFKTFSTIGNM